LTKLQTIEESLASLANKYQTLDQRRMIENEDFKTETKDLERRIKTFEKRYFDVDPTKTQPKERILSFKGAQRLEDTYDDAHEDDSLEEDSSAATINSEEFSLIKVII